VNPSYGTLSDFKAFLDAAHQRNMQVMIELVVNHTSDQHPWFKAAKLAPAGTPQRDMYVWSDSDQRFKDARVIFTDTEKSNWTWDETAKAYYWHRFFSHQPDLNYDNPLVMEEVLKAMRFWLDLGVDGLRMDAIPYLCERDGTSCENLPETHAIVRKLRAAIDAEYANRLILAEANQWPADVRPYFGNGDECHMAFHFPLMPRIYMALRQEDRLPITDIMAQTPPIPENCQWGLFLRNHDELTLEMVTDDERDYMYFAYSADPRMRINVGIRRRLAPLVDNNRRRIELLNSLLLSFPGTPILYYGDEIGMGDNIYLGDRNGVRTPMQWTSDRNGGFSKCDPARLYLPVVMDPIYGYQAVNVEAQVSDQSSLLHWTRNMIALRKLFQVFGRGTLTFLNPANRKVLAYLRDMDRGDGFHETVLCVANLSRFAQPVTLDLAQYAGYEPVEMLGYVPFPAITREPYAVTLAPYSFLWLELQQVAARDESAQDSQWETEDVVAAEIAAGAAKFPANWAEFIEAGGTAILEPALLEWLPRQRWFGAKTRTIESVHIRKWVELTQSGGDESAGFAGTSAPAKATIAPALFFFDVAYFNGPSDVYQIPLAMTLGADLDEVTAKRQETVIAKVNTVEGYAILHDAVSRSEFQQDLLRLIAGNATLAVVSGSAMGNGFVSRDGAEPAHVAAEAQASGSTPAGGGNIAVAPAPLSAQPGEAAAHSRSDASSVPSGSAHRLQPRESPTAGDEIASGDRLAARASRAFPAGIASQRLQSRVGSAEQSNTSIVYDEQLILKIFRRIQAEENPDVEIGRFLTEIAHFAQIPPFLGEISIHSPDGQKTTVAMLQGLVANRGDGWQWFLDQLIDWLGRLDGVPPVDSRSPGSLSEAESIPQTLKEARTSLEAAALLGRRTAELHVALSRNEDLSAFAPEALTQDELKHDSERIEAQIKSTLEALKLKIATFDDETADAVGLLLSRRPELIASARALAGMEAAGQRIRIHGDFHLGQTLRTSEVRGNSDAKGKVDGGDFVLLDFEGEPARPIQERRRKQSPLKDVAGMMRSFSYVAYAALDRFITSSSDDKAQEGGAREAGNFGGWIRAWQNAASAQFLRGYMETIAKRPGLLPPAQESQDLLKAYLLEKALYELLYELNNRPTWLRIPIQGILAL